MKDWSIILHHIQHVALGVYNFSVYQLQILIKYLISINDLLFVFSFIHRNSIILIWSNVSHMCHNVLFFFLKFITWKNLRQIASNDVITGLWRHSHGTAAACNCIWNIWPVWSIHLACVYMRNSKSIRSLLFYQIIHMNLDKITH